MKRLPIEVGRILLRLHTVVFPAVLVTLLAYFPPGLGNLNFPLDLLGLIFCLCGQSLRIAAIGYACFRRDGAEIRIGTDDRLPRGGFTLSRNPLYAGTLLIYIGLLQIQGNLIALSIGVLFFAMAYRAIVANEETSLAQKFGPAYAEYCRSANRWWPDLTRFKEATAGMTFNLSRVVVKEHNTLGAWVLCALLLYGNQSIELYDWGGARAQIQFTSRALVAVLLALVMAKIAKIFRWITA